MTKKKDPKDLVGAGRPTIMTPEIVNKLETAFSMGCTDLEACLFADISKQTLYNYQEKHPEFVDRKQMLKQKLVLAARAILANALKREDENTAKWYLERKRKDEFGAKAESEININIKQALVEFVDGEGACSNSEGVSTSVN